MALPAEVMQEVFQVIEGGADLGTPAQIIQFPSDNGQKVYEAVQKSYQGANGTGFNYWVAAFVSGVGAAARAVSAGAAYLAMDVGVVGAAVAPALGITTGFVLYNIAPSFWDSVAEKLMAAGATVQGKVVGMMNSSGVMTYTQEVIEIFKNAFLEAGYFNMANLPEYVHEGNVNVTSLISPLDLTKVIQSRVSYPISWTPEAWALFVSMLVQVQGKACAAKMDISYSSDFPAAWFSFMQFYDVEAGDTITLGETTYVTNTIGLRASFFNGTFYIIDCVMNASGAISGLNAIFAGAYTDSGHAYLSGINGEFTGEGIQNGAKVPGEEEFPLTYPNWPPNEFPDVDGHQLPNTYPLQYPDQLPDEEPYQDDAQNPDEDPDANSDPASDAIQDNEFDVEDYPEPSPEPDPDPQPEPDPIIPQPEPQPDPDPIKPDPDPTPTPIIPVPPLPNTVSSNKLFTVYNPTASQLDSLGGYLWDNSLIETLKKIWQNPLDGIISLIQVYATPSTGGSNNIILGYLDSGVPSAIVSNQFTTIDCGTINLKEKNKNATDYTPYTSAQIYLPFIGITELDINEIMRSAINIKYVVDVYTGTCLAQVKITRNPDTPNGAILYTFSGNCSQQLPLTSGDATGILRSLIGAAGAGLSIAAGGGVGLVAGASMVGNMLTHEMYHVGHSGNLSANSGIMGQKKPYLIVNRQRPYTANRYNEYYGFPINKTVYLNNCTGFTRVKSIRLQTSATDPEREEILAALQNGVIF